MHIDAFDYTLPKSLIAEHSVSPRDHARMLVLHRDSKRTEGKHVFDLVDYLRPDDLIVVNNTRVFKARLHVEHNGDPLELFFLRPDEKAKTVWQALLRPAKHVIAGNRLSLPDGSSAELITKNADGVNLLDVEREPEAMFALLDEYGDVPTPPYVTSTEENRAGYQTIYAEKTGSVAAPTAGFHLTKQLIARCKKKGVRFADVTLHVGLGTFRPIRTQYLQEHVMHEEWMHVSKDTIRAIKETKARDGRVIAVGTTSVRALESITAARELDQVPEETIEGFTRLFITPGFPFRVIDGLLTNFHLPKSTLLVLVSAFAGKDFVLDAYHRAVEEKYRFYSFGDAMLII